MVIYCDKCGGTKEVERVDVGVMTIEESGWNNSALFSQVFLCQTCSDDYLTKLKEYLDGTKPLQRQQASTSTIPSGADV